MMQPRPFTVHVPDEVLDDLRARLARTKWPQPLPYSSWASGVMNGKTRATPSTLNAMCATATRRASELDRMLAASAAAQVPMFAPSTIGRAPSRLRIP